MFAKLADTVMKHSRAVIALWIVILLCCVPFMLKADSVLEYELTNMIGDDSESAHGNKVMEEGFSHAIGMDEVLVVVYSPATPEENLNNLADRICILLSEKYSDTVSMSAISPYGDGDKKVMLYSFSSTDEGFDFAGSTGDIRSIVSQAKTDTGVDLTTYVTGNAALTFDTMDSANKDIAKIDPISVALIFVLLAVFFGGIVTAFVPPIGFGVAYGVAMLSIFLIGSMTGVFYLTSTLVMVTMLGAGCDYGIFIITRYREELKKGADHHDALKTSVMWAGESVFTSGLSVIIGFACLAICDFMMVRNMGIVLALGILFALVSALTFVPAVVNVIGEKVFWPNTIANYKGVETGSNTGIYARLSRMFAGYFDWVARFTRKRALPIAIAAVLVSVPAVYLYSTSTSSYDMIAVEPDGEAKEGLFEIMDVTYGGTLMPTYAVIEFDESVKFADGATLLMGQELPYLIWSEAGLKQTATGFEGIVPQVMAIGTEITTEYDIVASASGLTSWAVLYATAYAAIGDIDATNAFLLSQMPDAVKSYVDTVIESARTLASVYKIQHMLDPVTYPEVFEKMNVVPGFIFATVDIDGTPTDITLQNVVDYILNLGTGLLSDDGMAVSMMIVTKEKPMSDGTMDFVPAIREAFHGEGGYDSTCPFITQTYICGTNAIMYDISGTVTEQFNVIQIVVVVLLLLLLFLILGSYLTPIRAMVCIIASVVWTLALTFSVFQGLLGIPVCWIVPIVLFVVLLGLGMDYDIFITTRVRENRIRGLSNDDAIDAAIRSASGTISLCALIMGGTFLTMLVGSSSMLQEFGFALGVGILIDGLVMVTFVGPAVMHLMGEASWKGPAFLKHKHSE